MALYYEETRNRWNAILIQRIDSMFHSIYDTPSLYSHPYRTPLQAHHEQDQTRRVDMKSLQQYKKAPILATTADDIARYKP